MARCEFVKKITQLLSEMINEKDFPLIDYVKRSDEEQNRLFKLKKSQCDGFKIKSAHQRGMAMDIYFLKKGLKNVWLGNDEIPAQIINGKTQKEVNENATKKKINPINLQFSPINELDMSANLYNKWHQRWVELGGKKMIAWDICHFE